MGEKQLNSFRDLKVWQKAVDLTSSIYLITEKFSGSELYGLINQIRRSAVSISSNIAEGFKRSHKKEKLQFYNIAFASASEIESQIEVSYRLKFLDTKIYEDLMIKITEIEKMINGLIKSLNSKSYILNSNKGFTLIELIITITVAVILTTGAFLNVYNYKINQGVSSAAQEIVATLRVAQNYSLSQEDANRWGVYFENTEANGAFFALFPGLAYSATTTYTKNILPATIQFVLPASESSSSVVFAPITGLPVSSSTVKISLISNSNVSSTIIVNINGQIQYSY